MRIGGRLAGLTIGLASVAALHPAFAQTTATRHHRLTANVVIRAPDPTHPRDAMQPHTLDQALAAAYASNPSLLAARAQLRATDEGVPQALAGWRPTITISGGVGYGNGTTRSVTDGFATDTPNERDIFTGQVSVTQPLYRGGKTRAQTNQAENSVMAQRASLIASEEQVFTDTVNAYVGVIEAQQVEALNESNVQVLTRQLQATNDRFRVGEITRTDVAQAEAALAGGQAQLETAQGNLQTARATYLREIGFMPEKLIEPQALRVPLKTEQQAAQLAAANNPNVVAAQFQDAAARDAIDVAFSALMPSVNITASALRDDNSTIAQQRTIGGQALLNVTVPLYQGGAEYSAVRQARQTEQQRRKGVDDARRQAVQQAVQAWETLVAARSTAESTRVQIRANQIALDGVEREAILGSRTTLDVLNAQQALLNSEVTLVQNLASIVTASYTLASAIGRLTARDLNLSVPLYDETAYYHAVRDRLFGTGDYATGQPGR
ncbi:MAG TPA: TolC family outer membrane protein [Acetobacteraceae bacterium]|nr:TolC family outer membrane protein [Acetobacteraceae bacterium]